MGSAVAAGPSPPGVRRHVDVDAQPAQPLEDRGEPAVAAVQDPVELLDQRRVRRVGEVGEQVHARARVPGADLDAAHQRRARTRRRPQRPRPTPRWCRGRSARRRRALLRGRAHQLRRGLGAVGGPRVGMEVDAHEPQPRSPGGLTRPAGGRRTASPAAAGRRSTRRAGSSRRAAAASPRPAAAPSTASAHGLAGEHGPVESSSDELVDTTHSGTDLAPIRTRAGGWPSPTSRPGSLRRCPRTARPRPVPAPRRPRTRRPGRRARWCPTARHRRPRPPRPATTPKSVTRPARAHRPRQVRREAAAADQVLGERVVRRLLRTPQRRDLAVLRAGPAAPSRRVTGDGQRGQPATRRHATTVQ